MSSQPVIGVLALQGDFVKHAEALRRLGVSPLLVRHPDELEQVDGLIIPGGESTTVGKLMVRFGVLPVLQDRVSNGMPLFGTCMGMIVMASEIEGREQPTLGVLDVRVRRNAFGRQVDSFEADLRLKPFPDPPFRAVFIRAPIITHTGPEVEVLARYEEKIVFVRQGHLLGAAFHPELTDDRRVHDYFLQMVRESRG